ncbi:endonuclease/exonuclease/phosphatase family protein [Pseudofrankia sp. BMG5.36]|uniref:endonuclease/exonuclease/phosphatase family protein n=1 Tax=Pseudofrankia sp. BMG5.36 TaxID=1834512 RepID=UPI0008DA05B9|nr:endonuclease/exonuclease/phosphatase family protein [Pseudofrankia sp. BMG5.36]OHV47810.1 endonuclease [Pseudofrankia sp. BMG5.36]
MLLGTWNLENLFQPGGDFGADDVAVYQGKLSALAATINSCGVDVLGVQEVGDPDALADLVAKLDGTWHSALSTHFEPHHPIRVGVLSRLPFDTTVEAVDFPDGLLPVQVGDNAQTTTQMGRGALAVTVTPTPGKPLTVVVCHLKSKLLSFPAHGGGSRFSTNDEGERARFASYALHRRAAEAVTVRDFATRLLAGDGRIHRLAVVGDLNDEPHAATTQILTGPPGSEIGTAGFNRPDKGDTQRLWNLAAEIPPDKRYSRVFQGHGELIDHILISHALLAGRGPVTPLLDRPLPSVTDDPTGRRKARDSDHAPILAELTL